MKKLIIILFLSLLSGLSFAKTSIGFSYNYTKSGVVGGENLQFESYDRIGGSFSLYTNNKFHMRIGFLKDISNNGAYIPFLLNHKITEKTGSLISIPLRLGSWSEWNMGSWVKFMIGYSFRADVIFGSMSVRRADPLTSNWGALYHGEYILLDVGIASDFAFRFTATPHIGFMIGTEINMPFLGVCSYTSSNGLSFDAFSWILNPLAMDFSPYMSILFSF